MPRESNDYDVIRVRTEHDIKEKVDKLKELIFIDTGMRVSSGDAVNVAVIEAIERRRGEA